jgi:hypothetical protein
MSLAPIIARLDPDGSLSLRVLAAKLTADGDAQNPRRLTRFAPAET